jgi:hypothetical protein
MSQVEIQNIFNKVPTDNDLKDQLLSALGALSKEDEDFKQQLLTELDAAPNENRKKKEQRSFFSNLKMEGIVQVILSGTLIAVFVIFAYLTFAQINTKPEGIPMSDGHMEMYDPFTRAKDLLTLIIPTFTIVVSFWLGFSIQEKKVNEARTIADGQRVMREKADTMMAKIEGRMMTMTESDDITNLSNDIHTIMGG